MTQRIYITSTALIFLLIALLHLLRLVFGWEALVGGWAVPSWLSVVALVVAGCLGYEGVRLIRKS